MIRHVLNLQQAGVEGTLHLAELFLVPPPAGDTLRLQFPAEDLGFKYGVGALHQDATQQPRNGTGDPPPRRGAAYVPSSATGELLQTCQAGQIRCLEDASVWLGLDFDVYLLVAAAGCRLPHCWLEDRGESLDSLPAESSSSSSGSGRLIVRPAESLERQMGPNHISSLDLAAGAGTGLVLVVDCTSSSRASLQGEHAESLTQAAAPDQGCSSSIEGLRRLRAACEVAAEDSRLPLQVVAVLSRQGGGGKLQLAESVPLGISAEPQSAAPARVVYEVGAWCVAMGLPPGISGGSVHLVRPDGHVAWRCLPTAGADTFKKQIRAAVRLVLSLS